MTSEDELVINATGVDPEVNLNSVSGKLLIKGKCISENPENFFSPVYDWMETHLPAFPDDIYFEISVVAFRPQSLLEIAKLIRLLDKNIMQKKKVRIVWRYHKNDEETKEAGELLGKMLRKDLEYELV